jgi:hypothetical protein
MIAVSLRLCFIYRGLLAHRPDLPLTLKTCLLGETFTEFFVERFTAVAGLEPGAEEK